MTDRTDEAKLPRIYGVNWFRKDADGKFLWPGFGENSRVLEWICRRLEGEADGDRDRRSAPCPAPTDLELDGLDAPPEQVAAALARRRRASGSAELPTMHEHFASFGDQLPAALARRARRARAAPRLRRRVLQVALRSAPLAAGADDQGGPHGHQRLRPDPDRSRQGRARGDAVRAIAGVVAADDVTGPYDVIVRTEAESLDDLGKMVVSQIQAVEGITRTFTCPVVNL